MTKAFIKLGQYTIIENTINLLKELFDDIIIVTNNIPDFDHLNVASTRVALMSAQSPT